MELLIVQSLLKTILYHSTEIMNPVTLMLPSFPNRLLFIYPLPRRFSSCDVFPSLESVLFPVSFFYNTPDRFPPFSHICVRVCFVKKNMSYSFLFCLCINIISLLFLFLSCPAIKHTIIINRQKTNHQQLPCAFISIFVGHCIFLLIPFVCCRLYESASLGVAPERAYYPH